MQRQGGADERVHPLRQTGGAGHQRSHFEKPSRRYISSITPRLLESLHQRATLDSADGNHRRQSQRNGLLDGAANRASESKQKTRRDCELRRKAGGCSMQELQSRTQEDRKQQLARTRRRSNLRRLTYTEEKASVIKHCQRGVESLEAVRHKKLFTFLQCLPLLTFFNLFTFLFFYLFTLLLFLTFVFQKKLFAFFFSSFFFLLTPFTLTCFTLYSCLFVFRKCFSSF